MSRSPSGLVVAYRVNRDLGGWEERQPVADDSGFIRQLLIAVRSVLRDSA